MYSELCYIEVRRNRMIAIKAHFDGKVLVPDEPLELPANTPLVIEIKEAEQPAKAVARTPGLHRGTVWMSDNFDEPLTEEFLLGEG